VSRITTDGMGVSGRPREYTVVVSVRSLATIVLVVVLTLAGVMMLERASVVFALLGAAATVAVIAAPAVAFLDRRLPRGLSILLVTLAGIGTTVGTLALVAWDLDRQAGAVNRSISEAIGDLAPGSTAADLARDLDVERRVDAVLDGAAARVVIGDTNPLAVAGQVGKVVLVAVIAAFLVSGGRKILSAGIRHIRRQSIREQFHHALDDVVGRAGAYLRRTLTVSIAHGIAAGVVANLFGLPGSITLGTWVALMSTVPITGGVLAWLPVVAAGVAADVPTAVIAAIGLVLVVADRLARARWVHAALRVGPLLGALGIGLGMYLVGVSGALLGLFVVAVIAALLSHDDHLRAAIVDLVEDPEDRAIPAAQDQQVDDVPVLGEPRENETYLRVRPSARTAATIALTVIAATALLQVLRDVRPLILWFAVALFIAFGLDRPISFMHRKWRIPRPGGTALVLGAAAAVVGLVVVLAGPSITDSSRTIAADAPETVESLESLPLVGEFLDSSEASTKVEEFLASIPERLRESDAVERIASAAGDGLTGLFWTVTLMLAILWDGPRLVSAVRGRIPVRRRRRASQFGRAAYTAVSNVVAASAFVAALNGSVVMLLAIGLGIPLAPVLGLWAFTWNFIPQIGGFVTALPLVALGFGEGTWQGVAALLAFGSYQTFENHVIQPLVGSRVVRVPPLVFLVGALVGGSLAGFVGALMAAPLLGVAKVALTMFSEDDDRFDDLPRRSVRRTAPD
jgi:predicted PurR-regulated permease PerM